MKGRILISQKKDKGASQGCGGGARINGRGEGEGDWERDEIEPKRSGASLIGSMTGRRKLGVRQKVKQESSGTTKRVEERTKQKSN